MKQFTALGPGFYDCKERLLRQYVEPCFDSDSGVAPEVLDEEFEEILGMNAPRILIKARLLALVMRKARIHVDAEDWFADHFEGRKLLEKLREKWRSELSSTTLQSASEIFRRSFRTGAADAELDLGHVSPGWRRLLERGVPGLLEDARSALPAAQGDRSKEAFREAAIIVLEGLRCFIGRLKAQAEKIGKAFPAQGDRMEKLARCLENLTRSAPCSFYEALQLSYLYHQFVEFEGERIRSMGSFERNFGAFFQRDVDNGLLTPDDAAELIRFYWNKFFATTLGVDNGKNFYFGGQISPGKDAVCKLTDIALACFYELKQTDPKLSIKVHKGSSDKLLGQIAQCIRDGRTSMVIVNDDIAVEALLKQGKDPADVYDYLLIGCYEPAIEGREVGCNMSIKINLAKTVELVFHRGTDPRTGENIGVDTGALESITSFDDFFSAYRAQLLHQVELVTGAVAAFEPHWPQINPSPLLSSTFVDCVENLRDVSMAGAKYNNTGCVGVGLANAADSLESVRELVFHQKKLSLSEFAVILGANWRGNEKLRQYVKNRVKKWGNNLPSVDGLAKGIAEFYASIVNGRANGRGGCFSAALFSLDFCLIMGKRTGALPDGREDGAFLAKGAGAMTGMDKEGVTAQIESVNKIDFRDFPDGSVLDIFLHPSAVQGEEGLQAIIGLIRTYFHRGGFGIQFNIFDADELREAQKQPEKYKTLQVRLCGWNVYFVSLTAEQQKQFIESTMQGA